MTDDPLAAARRLYERGVAANDRGKPRTAESLLRRALGELAGSAARSDASSAAALACRVDITFAWTDYQLHGLDAGLGRLAAAARRAEEHGITSVHTSMQNQRGVLLLYAGRLTDASREFDAALPFASDVPALDRCKVLLNRGVVRMELGRVPAARGDLARCAALARDAGLDVQELKATHNLGYAEFLAGDLPAALRSMDAAWAMDPTVAPGTALLGKAQVLVEAGLVREADATLARAEHVFRRDRLARDLAETQLERARCALFVGDATAARRFAARARDSFRRRGNDHWRRAAEIVLLQGDLAAGRPGQRLVAPALRLRAEYLADGLPARARTAALLATEAHLAVDDPDAAKDTLAGVDRARPGDPITGRLHDGLVRARLDAASGRPADASRRVRSGLAELARYQAGFGSTDLATAAAVHGRRLGALDIDLALRTGRASAVFAAAERARSVTSRMAAVRPPEDPVAAELLTELRQIAQALRDLEATDRPGGDAERRQHDALHRRRADLQRQVLARSWAVSGGRTLSRPAPLAAVRARLAELARTMVMYVQAGDTLAAVTVGPRLRLHRLGRPGPVRELIRRVRSDLDVLAHPGIRDDLRAVVRTSLERSLARLDEALVVPIDVDGPLVVVSTGGLGQLPWASLPSLAGRSLVVAPSATKWLASAGRTTDEPIGPVVAVAGPDLARAEAEAVAVADAWGSRPVLGVEATGARLAESLAGAGVLHVAAHGVHQPENPLFSSLRMADGPVYAHELDQHATAPPHVVLSACESGLATVRPGDEALGLASVLLALGTSSVVAGVARVGDDLAEQTMADYHRRLARGTDSASALAAALAAADSDVVPPFVNLGAAWVPAVTAASRPDLAVTASSA